MSFSLTLYKAGIALPEMVLLLSGFLILQVANKAVLARVNP
jgi:hypothetical protein